MGIVVTDNCSDCRFMECITVCPVQCFHLDERMLYINPVTCIECRACIGACPVNAIYDTDELPSELDHWVEINSERSRALPTAHEKFPPLASAEAKRASLGL
jgi:ferredoxin